jgi:hypothetical protein
MTHAIAWHTAQPLWSLSLADGGSSPARFRQPAVLRFAGDDYMKQLERSLQLQPPSLSNYVARPETWDDERAGWRTETEGPDTEDLRLFQPAHHRFYCIAAALVCQMPGLPERVVNVSRRERAAFVMRRLFPRSGVIFDENDSSTYDEFAWVGTAQQGSWRPVPNPQLLLADEERLALTPKTFDFESGKRTLQIGLIPVARRDIYQAGVSDVTAPVPAALLQADSFSSEAAATAWQLIDKSLEELRSDADPNGVNGTSYDDVKKVTFAHALLNIADFLAAELPAVSQALPSGTGSGLTAAQNTLLGRLNQVLSTGQRLRQMLVAVSQPSTRAAIESGSITASAVDAVLGADLNANQLGALANAIRGTNGELRDLLVAAIDARIGGFARAVTSTWDELAKPGLGDQAAQDALLGLLLRLSEYLSSELPEVWTALGGATGALTGNALALATSLLQTRIGNVSWAALLLDADARRKDILANRITPQVLVVAERLTASQIAATLPYSATLDSLVRAALAAKPLPSKTQAHQQLVASPPPAPDPDAWYRARCVYEQPQCTPIHDPVVSEPSVPFQLAGFFDPAAPIRPIRIQMPEASLDQLRRGAKGLGIATSKELRSQVDRARNAGLKGLIDKDVPNGQPFDFGLICQLSIPIITICAFILLMIIVGLLNLIFQWIPYFILCLPRIGKKS